MDTYQIILEPDPILHKISEEVTEVNDEIRQILQKMYRTMIENDGIGLAAVQVGILKKLIVIEIEGKTDGPIFLINAKIKEKSENQTVFDEGCLSVLEVKVPITRPEFVTVSYLNEHGKMCEIEAGGLFAKCLQHEIDHTNGIVMIDLISSKIKKDMILRRLQKLKKRIG